MYRAMADIPRADESLTTQVQQHGFRWLKFPEALENQFRDEHRASSHRLVRLSVWVAILTSTGFLLIDSMVIKAVNGTPNLVRFGVQFPVLAVCLLATSRRFYLRWYEPAIIAGLPIFGLGTVFMTTYAQQEHMPLVGARLLLVTFFCYFMVGLRFRTALACNALVFAFLVATTALGMIPIEMGSYLAFALICANIIGSVGAYALEHASRTAFIERRSLEEMAARDGLTRLLNRQTFEYRARNLWRTATTLQRPIAVLMIDVDYFKRYNDHYGHQAGDECLRKIATAVREAIAPSQEELVARYGGEELIALLVDRSATDVANIARNIVEHVTRQGILHQASMVGPMVSVSVGATMPTADADLPFNALVNVADQALYTAKHQGRNRSIVVDPQEASGNLNLSPGDGPSRPESRALRQAAGNVTALEGTAAV
jgi:diguanylate cyclase (GGDEF)-like protein